MYAGTAAEQVIASHANTFEDLLPSVTIILRAVTDKPAMIVGGKDMGGTSARADGLVDALNEVFGLSGKGYSIFWVS